MDRCARRVQVDVVVKQGSVPLLPHESRLEFEGVTIDLREDWIGKDVNTTNFVCV